jgi:hypothetical protein
LKLNVTHQLVVHADCYILGRSVHIIDKNNEPFVVTRGKIGLVVTVEKSRYMTMSGDQNAERSHSMKTGNSSFGRVGEFKYLGTTLTNKSFIQEETKSYPKI